jgi:hypothetical protein
MMRFLGVVALVAMAAAIMFALLRPVCVPIPQREYLHKVATLEDGKDRDLFVVKIYQQQGSGYFECKTWLTREVLE